MLAVVQLCVRAILQKKTRRLHVYTWLGDADSRATPVKKSKLDLIKHKHKHICIYNLCVAEIPKSRFLFENHHLQGGVEKGTGAAPPKVSKKSKAAHPEEEEGSTTQQEAFSNTSSSFARNLCVASLPPLLDLLPSSLVLVVILALGRFGRRHLLV